MLALSIHDFLFNLVVAESYRKASHLFPWMILSGGVFATAQLLSLKLMSELRSNDLILAKIGSAVIGVIANIFGAYYFGVSGVVFGVLIFSISFYLLVVMVASRTPIGSTHQRN